MNVKRLILMRHAKSSWGSHAVDDHSRPLNSRGRADAPRMGARLAELGWAPDIVLSSDSHRTRETYERMSGAFDAAPIARFSRGLYNAGIRQLQPLLAELGEEATTVLVLGHNPGWSAAASWFSGTQIDMTTANAVLLTSIEARWSSAVLAEWTLHDWIQPKSL
jgi:phosphohistidine phosphatase